MRQRLYQTVTASADANGNITLAFPSVPQGLTWTGAVMLFQGGGSYTPNLPPFYEARWSLYRNQSPLISYGGETVAYDVQAVGQESIRVVGTNLVPQEVVTATWIGYSDDDPTTTPLLYPRLYAGGSGFADVTPIGIFPDPTAVGLVTGFVAAASTTQVMLPGVAPHNYSLWSVTLNLSTAWTATSGSPVLCQAKVQLTGAGGDILGVETIIMPGGAQTVSSTLELHGYQGGAGLGVQLNVGAFTGTTVRANATLTFTP